MPRHIFVDKKATYNKWSEGGYIDPNAFYYIKESSEIITHGQLFGGDPSKFVLSNDPRLTDKRVNPYALIIKKQGVEDVSYDGSDTAEIVIPTTLPASDVFEWAKAETKPEYTYEEVGAAPADHVHDQYLTTLTPQGVGNAVTGFVRGETGEYILQFDSTFLVSEDLEPYALIDSPNFTGTPTAPTIAINDSTAITTNAAVKTFVEGKNYITANDTSAAAKKLAQLINIALANQVRGTTTFDGSQNVSIDVTLQYIAINQTLALDEFLDTGLYSGAVNLINAPVNFTPGIIWELKVSRLNYTENTWGVKQEIAQGDSEYYRIGEYNHNAAGNHIEWTEWIKRLTSGDSIQGDAQNVSGIVTVAHGGTGLSSISNKGLLIGNESGEFTIIEASVANKNNTLVERDFDGTVYAAKYVGPLQGNADTATKATQDASGNVITDTYEKKTDKFWLGETEIPLNGVKGPITLTGVSFEGQGTASQDSEGNIISQTYVRKNDTFFLGTTSISHTAESGSISSLDIDITGNAKTSTTADQAKKLNHMVELKFLGAVTGSVNTDLSLNKYEITLSVNHNHDSSYLKKNGDTMTGYLKSQSYLEFTNPDVHPYILAKSSASTYWKIIGYESGALDLGVTGSSTEIYATQYSDQFATISRRIKLFDNLGNTSFPGTVTATKFIGEIEAKVSESVKADKDSNDETIHETYQRKDSSIYLGRTAVRLDRTAGELNLAGVNIEGSSTSCTGNAATVTNGVYTVGNNTLLGNYIFNNAPKLQSGLILALEADSETGLTIVDKTDNTIQRGYIGFVDSTQDYFTFDWSSNPSTNSSLRVGESLFTYKGHNVYHAGNANLSTVDWNARNLNAANVTASGEISGSTGVIAGTNWGLITLVNTDSNTTSSGIYFASGSKASNTVIASIGTDENGNVVIAKTGGVMMMKVSPAGVVESAGGFKGDLVGNADTAYSADKFTKKVTLNLTGDVTGSAEFDGSEVSGINLNTEIVNNWSFLTDGSGNALASVTINSNTQSVTFTYGTYLVSTDLEPYALSSSVPTKTSDLDNDAGFLVQGNLADYALASSIPTSTSQLTNDSGYLVISDLGDYALAANIPTKLSDLTDDLNVVKKSANLTSGQIIVAAGTDTVKNGYSVQTTLSQIDTAIPTSKAVATYVGNALTSAMTIKGTVGQNGTVSALPSANVKIGDSYRVITAGTYGGQKCEVGDIIFAISTTPDWHVVQNNTDVFIPATGASNGSVGLVPAPTAGQVGYLLTTAGWTSPADLSIGTAADSNKLGGELPSHYAVAHEHPYLSDATLYAGSLTQGGAATSATKLSAKVAIKIGNKSLDFDGSAGLTYTLADIGAQAAGNYASSSHNHDTTYVKLAESSAQIITSTQGDLGNGLLELYRKSNAYSMIGFTNNNGSGTKQLLGLLGFKTDGTPIVRIGNLDYNILHSNNSSITESNDVVTIKINNTSKTVSGSGHKHTYSSLDGLPTLGTMAAENKTDYSVSGGGSTWGSKITVKIAGTEKSLTIPSNPNTDETVKIDDTNPSSGTWYYPVWHTATSASTATKLKANDGFRYYVLQGTASAAGRTIIQVGNATQTGTAGNKYGELWLYSQKQGYARFVAGSNLTAETTFTFDSAGTVLTSGNYNSYAPKKDGTGASGSWGISITGKAATAGAADYVLATNNSANPGGALLRTGSNRKDDATGNTWIFLDQAGGTDNPWGIKHNQVDNDIEFYGSGNKRVTIHLGSSKVTATTFDGNATSASKLGTDNVGENLKPIYLVAGVPTALSGDLGSGTKPIYVSGGKLTQSNSDAGGKKKFIYMAGGTLTATDQSLGSSTKLIYLDGGEFKEGSNLDDWLKRTGGTMTGNITFSSDSYIMWSRNSDYAKIHFVNASDGDTNSYMGFETGDNGNEYFRFGHTTSSTYSEWMNIKSTGITVAGAGSFGGNLSVAGTSTLTGATTLSSTLSVAKESTLKGKVSITGYDANNISLDVARHIKMASTYQIKRNGNAISWYQGRDYAIVIQDTYSGYSPIISAKTTAGDWSLGPYSNNILYLTYFTDTKHNSQNNVPETQFTWSPDGAYSMGGALSVGGNASITGTTSLSSTLSVSGATTMSSTLTVNSTSLFKGDISLNDSASITHLKIGGGIYWDPKVESASDPSDAASITVVKSGVAGGTTLVIAQLNDAADTIQFSTHANASLYHNSNVILSGGNTYWGTAKVLNANETAKVVQPLVINGTSKDLLLSTYDDWEVID